MINFFNVFTIIQVFTLLALSITQQNRIDDYLLENSQNWCITKYKWIKKFG